LLTGAELKAEQDEAETAGCRAGGGEGEGASAAGETSRLFLKESR